MTRLTPCTDGWDALRSALARDEAVAAVGPGWAALADAAHAAGVHVTTMKEKLDRFECYAAGLPWPSPAADALHAAPVAITDASVRTCEACGAPGQTWTDERAPPLLSGKCRRLTWRKTLCQPCAWRYYAESVRGWDRVAGRWQEDAIADGGGEDNA